MSNLSSPVIGLLLVALVAFLAPFLIDITRARFLPAVVLEIVFGIIIGPQVLHWVNVDTSLSLLSEMGLCYLLFLSGMEVELERLRGRLLAIVGGGFLLSLIIALLFGLSLKTIVQGISPFFLALLLSSTSLGIVIAILKDAGESSSDFGQLIIAGSTAGELGTIILLSLFFSNANSSSVSRFVLLGIFFLLVLILSLAVFRVRRSAWFADMVQRLQDTTAQISVRAALLLLVAVVAMAAVFGAASILGAFLAGVLLKFAYKDPDGLRPQFRIKLEALGFGFFVPIFFISSGLTFDLHALLAHGSTLLLVPVLLVALLVVRGMPTLLYAGRLGKQQTVIAAFLQATSLPFIVAATEIGLQLGLLTQAISSALIMVGLLSVIVYPSIALLLLRRMKR
jgi:Kef-type K+ transport system membrane component KefB